MPQHAEREHDPNDVLMHHVRETAELGETISSTAHELAPDSLLPPGLGLLSGITGTTASIFELARHPSIGNGLDVASGAAGVVENGARLVAPEVAEKLGPVGSALGAAKTLNDLRNGDLEGATHDGVGTALGLMGPEGAAAAAAWNFGWSAGKHLDHWANGEAAERNYLGGHRTVDQHSMDVGDHVNAWVGHGKVGQVAGAFAAAGTGLVDTGYTGLRYGVDEAGDGVKWAGRKLGGAASAARSLLPGQGGPSIPEIVDREVHARMTLDHARAKYADSPAALETQLQAMRVMGYGSLVADPLRQLAADRPPAAAPRAQTSAEILGQVFGHYAE